MIQAMKRSRFDRAALGRLRLLMAACAVMAASPGAAESPRAARIAPELSERLDTVLTGRAFRGARVSALVVRDRDGAVLYSRMPDRLLTPASNLKLLTAIAALSTFGPSHQFSTVVSSNAPPDSEGAVDRLSVRGVGDPAINAEDWWRLASMLHHRGLRRVRGDLILDDSAFDRRHWHPSWGRTSSRAYHAPVGALTANYGAFAVTVTPGARPGDPVRVDVDPPVPYLGVSNGASTGPASARSSLVVDRRRSPEGESVIVRGVARAGRPAKTYYRSVLDPTAYAGSVLRMQLEAVGIRIDGRVIPGTVAEAGHELLEFEGRPLAEIVRLFVKYSNNAIAETLVKAIGARDGGVGSWETGIPAVERELVALGLDGKALSLVDGSGLSYENKVTPRVLVDALRMARHSFAFGPELVAALPIAAADGTLAERAEGAQDRIRAKTGLLNGITGLSGFAERPDGEVVAFSILVNGYRSGDDAAMRAMDGFVAELVSGAGSTAAVGR